MKLVIVCSPYQGNMHCHDEVVTEVEYGFGSVEEVCDIMSKPPEWAKDLPLTAEGFECEYYRK